MNTKPYDAAALTVIIIGAINWGLIGFFQFDLIAVLFGGMSSLISRIIYGLVGLCGLYALTIYSRITDSRLMEQRN
ncbi:MAG: DUF378 domain-containing protein [Eubacterium sp.]|nr:DUF378 domain-containing protein [Eubacterium sp.]MCD7855970.1 DUF378 domain-containing protein [Clostridiales bacterium]